MRARFHRVEEVDEDEVHLNLGTEPRASTVKRSTWFITINSNQRPYGALQQEFHEACLSMMREEGLEEIVDFQPGHALSTHMVESDARVATEIGAHPKGRRVHTHILLATRHRSRIRLNKERMKNWIFDRVTEINLRSRGSLYINWVLVGYTQNLEEYLEKYKLVGPTQDPRR